MDRNEVVLTGRLPELVQVKTLQSGARFGTWRLIVRRRHRGRGARVDTIPCVSFDSGIVDAVTCWLPDDMVEVTGSLRRRWWGSDKTKASGYEVEVRSVKLLERQVTTVLTGDGIPFPAEEVPPPAPAPARPRSLSALLNTAPTAVPGGVEPGTVPHDIEPVALLHNVNPVAMPGGAEPGTAPVPHDAGTAPVPHDAGTAPVPHDAGTA
ncbi:single-stranded DNA-binding protein, partial [Planobispora takensis]